MTDCDWDMTDRRYGGSHSSGRLTPGAALYFEIQRTLEARMKPHFDVKVVSVRASDS